MEAVPGKKKKMLTETLQPVLCLFIHFRICFSFKGETIRN